MNNRLNENEIITGGDFFIGIFLILFEGER